MKKKKGKKEKNLSFKWTSLEGSTTMSKERVPPSQLSDKLLKWDSESSWLSFLNSREEFKRAKFLDTLCHNFMTRLKEEEEEEDVYLIKTSIILIHM
jgi:hypothetical protein